MIKESQNAMFNNSINQNHLISPKAANQQIYGPKNNSHNRSAEATGADNLHFNYNSPGQKYIGEGRSSNSSKINLNLNRNFRKR